MKAGAAVAGKLVGGNLSGGDRGRAAGAGRRELKE